jgi:hypothetical protein
MKDFEQELLVANRFVDTALRVGIWLVALFLAICSGLYVWKFHSGISSKAEVWSAFGSFFGGVFSPLISGVTLVALVKTISLQHHMMVAQKRDANSVIRMQAESLKNQMDQLEIAKVQMEGSRVSDFRNSLIRTLEQRVTYYQTAQADALTRISTLKQLDEGPEVYLSITELARLMPKYKEEVTKLLKLSLKLSVMEFATVEALRAYVAAEVTMVLREAV